MGGNTRQNSNARSKSAKKNEKKRLPSLHIGNLPAKFYDLDLFKLIKQRGFACVKAIVVVDKKTNKSLNYGYAQFLTIEAAIECQKAMNNIVIDDKVITVSVQQIDSKPDPKANILVRNLATTASQKEVFEFYSKFGEI
jgi:RNA recognition motif-containing protein